MNHRRGREETMRFRDHYDWIVLGDHPGALLSACLASKLGLSVLVLPFISTTKLNVAKSDQPIDFESNYLIGLRSLVRSNGLLAECLAKVGIHASEQELIRSENVLPQILSPSARVLFTLDDEDLGVEFSREFGSELVAKLAIVRALKQSESEFLQYWLRLPQSLTIPQGKKKPPRTSPLPNSLSQVSSRKLLKAANLEDHARRIWTAPGNRVSDLCRKVSTDALAPVLEGLWYGVTSNQAENPHLMDVLHLMALGRTGASFKGGMTAYREFLLDLAKRTGANVAPKADCQRVFVQNGKFVGVQVASLGNMIGAGGGVAGCSLEHVKNKVTYSGRNWFKNFKSAPQPIGWKMSIALTVHAEAVPPGMSSRMVWQENGAPPLEIEVSLPSDYSKNGADQFRVIFLRTLLPFSKESLEPQYQRLIAGRMFRKLVEILPFLEFHVVRIYPDFREADRAGKKSGISDLYGFSGLEMIPSCLRCFSGEGLGSRSGIDSFYVASEESFPDLGSLGGTVAALDAVSGIAHEMGLPGAF